MSDDWGNKFFDQLDLENAEALQESDRLNSVAAKDTQSTGAAAIGANALLSDRDEYVTRR